MILHAAIVSETEEGRANERARERERNHIRLVCDMAAIKLILIYLFIAALLAPGCGAECKLLFPCNLCDVLCSQSLTNKQRAFS